MDVKPATKTTVTSGHEQLLTPHTNGWCTVSLIPVTTTPVLDIPAKHHAIKAYRTNGALFLHLEDLDGLYSGDELKTLVVDLMKTVDTLVDEFMADEEDEDDDEPQEDEDEVESEETPPPPAVRAQADGAEIGTVEIPEATFCECADCRRRRI